MNFKKVILFFLFTSFLRFGFSQTNIYRDFFVLNDYERRSFLLDTDSIVPLNILLYEKNEISIELSPLNSFSRINTKRPYGWNDYGLNPNVGFQQYISSGIESKWKFVTLNFKPEIYYNSNLKYNGFPEDFDSEQVGDRFQALNKGDYPEYFGRGNNFSVWWGQSKFAFNYGAFEFKLSTENIWWGPGQWNSLIFSNNARGFPHLSINTVKPAKTFLGDFQGQLLIGSIQDSGLDPLINQEYNDRYFKPFNGDFKYLNAIMMSYNPKWVKGLHLGFSRTFQVYNNLRGNSFYDWFPVFEGFQKKNFFNNGNTVDFDRNGRDQQVTIFGRYISKKAKTELYFEFGKRDHNYSWREFILNPEHARAFILGFNKLFSLPKSGQFIQVRSEITQQQESINRYIRYPGLKGNNSWATNTLARGFSNFGQAMGVGSGLGSNIQTIEISKVEGFDKLGILLERLENNQDYFYKAQFQNTERKPWVDFSLGFLFNKRFDRLLFNSKIQIIHAKNYQWQLDPSSTPDFPKGKNITSMMAEVSFIYFWNKKNQNQ